MSNQDEVIRPEELAGYLSNVFRDPEVTSFERTQAAVGLSTLWLGVRLDQLIEDQEL